jgi:hypothetical protein
MDKNLKKEDKDAAISEFLNRFGRYEKLQSEEELKGVVFA